MSKKESLGNLTSKRFEYQKLERKIFIARKIRIGKLFVSLLISFFFVLGTNGQEKKNTEHTADRNLKGSTRINPSTLAMEFSLPLGGYPGRAGNSAPVVLSYSSKVWHQKTLPLMTRERSINEPNIITEYVTAYNQFPSFGKRTIAGWTSSLQMPAIIYEAEFYNQNGEVHPLSAPPPDSFQNTPTTVCNGTVESYEGYFYSSSCGGFAYARGHTCCPPNDFCTLTIDESFCVTNGYGDGGGGGGGGINPTPSPTPTPEIVHAVPRLRVHMPDGSSQEFRKSDNEINCVENQSACYSQEGSYLSVNGTGMRLEISTDAGGVTSKSLNLPDGGKYIFTNDTNVSSFYHQATYYVDRYGNKSKYNDTTGVWTDTLGRSIKNPLPGQLRYASPPPNNTQDVYLPGMSQPYKMTWKNLRNVNCVNGSEPECQDTVLENSSAELKYTGNDSCQSVLNTNPVGGASLFSDYTPDITMNYPNSTNGYRTIDRSRMCAATPPFNPDSGGSTVVPEKFNPVVLAETELPNGQKYTFKYNEYGEITKITYPTGASERFRYEIVQTVGGGEQTNRGVRERWVYDKNGAEIQYWQYNAQSGMVTTIAPDNSKTVRLFTPETGQGGFGFTNPLSGFPIETRGYDTLGRMVNRSFTKYRIEPARIINGVAGNADATRDPRPEKTISIMIEPGSGSALATQSETVYDSQTEDKYFAHLNPKETKTTHYVSLGEAQAKDESKTLTDFENLFNAPKYASISQNEYIYDSNYLGRGISSLLKETKILNPDNQSIVLAKTQTIYDKNFPVSVPGYPYLTETYGIASSMECPTSGGSATCWESPGTAYLGQPTTSRVWNADTGVWIETHSRFDIFGNVVAAKDPVGNETQSLYENSTQKPYLYAYPTKIIAPAPDPNNSGFGTNQTSTAETTYDLTTGLVTEVKNDFGQITKTEYNDALLRPTRVYASNFTAPEAQTIYDDVNLTVKVRKQIDATNWNEATTFSDSLGRTIKTQTKDAQGDVFTETEYDNLGRVKRATNPYRAGETKLWSKPRYDELGRAVESFAPAQDGQTGASLGVTSYSISTVPNYTGTVVTSADAAGRKSRSITNALGQLLRIYEPTSTGGTADADLGAIGSPLQATHYTYDALGKMVKVQQENQYRYFKYDSLGRLIRVRQPEQQVNTALNLADGYNTTGQWTAGYSYDVLGNVITTTDANGVTITNTYDNASRVKTRSYAGEPAGQQTPTVYYTYDGVYYRADNYKMQAAGAAKGSLTQVRNGISTSQTIEYDSLGRAKKYQQITDNTTYQTQYEYNLAGALIKETYPQGRVVQNEFNPDGDVSRIFGKANAAATEQTYANAFTYTADGNIKSLHLGNNLWESAKFNDRLQVTELNLGHSATDGSLWKLGYEYGELETNGTVNTAKNTGNIAKQTISFNGLATPFVQTFKYDALNRLKEAKEMSGSTENWYQQFNYDRYGNRLRSGSQDKMSGAVMPQNNLTFPTINAADNRFDASQSYTYDKNGNIISDVDPVTLQSRSFTFNGENKQTVVKDANNNPIGTYFYDGEGKRVKKVTNTETTIFVYSGGKLIAEYSTVDPPTTPTTSYTATDQLGSPRVITNSLGEVIARRDFQPFGDELYAGVGGRTGDAGQKYSSTKDKIRQKFTGYQRDDETGLDFAEARYYNNAHGRFTAVDPLLASGNSANPQSFNRYTYVTNNPLLFTDPTGLIGDYYSRSGRYIGSDGNPDDKNVYFADIHHKEGETTYVTNQVVTNMAAVGAARAMAQELGLCGYQCGGLRDPARDSENAYAFREGSRGFGSGFVNQAKSWADIPSYNFNPGTPVGLSFLFSENSLASNGIVNRWFSYTGAQNEYQAAGQVGGAFAFDFAATAGTGAAVRGIGSGVNAFRAGGMTFGERLFNSAAFGKDSFLFGNKHFSATKTPGLLNKPGSSFKVGWSSTGAEMNFINPRFATKTGNSLIDGGQQIRFTLFTNGNQGLRHLYVPRTFVTNQFANPFYVP